VNKIKLSSNTDKVFNDGGGHHFERLRHLDLREKFQGGKNVKNVERTFCNTFVTH